MPVSVDEIIFWAFASVSVIAAIGLVTNKSIIKAALLLLVVFLSQAAFFILNNADFLAIAQVLVYAVGLTIVLLFAIMFTGDKPLSNLEKAPVSKGTTIMMTLIVLYTAGVLFAAISYPFQNIDGGLTTQQINVLLNEGSTRILGQTLFGRFGLPFELAGILLTAAMIGAIVLSKKKFDDENLARVKYAVDMASHPTQEANAAYSATRHAVVAETGEIRELETASK